MNFYDLYLEVTAPKQVRLVFVCFGNTDRSPMAEALAKQILGNKAIVSSAGYRPEQGRPASPNCQLITNHLGADATTHASRTFCPQIVKENDIVVFLDRDVAKYFANIVPKSKMMIMPIPNPKKTDVLAFWDTAQAILSMLRRVVVPMVNRYYAMINEPKKS